MRQHDDHERPAGGWLAALGAVAVVGAAAYLVLRKAGSSAYTGSYKPEKGKLPKEKGVLLERSITLMRRPEELYAFWRKLDNLPRFMGHLESVRELDARRSHWVAKAPAGVPVEWEAEITEDTPNRRIAWRSLPGSQIPNEGSVSFEDLGPERGTVIKLRMRYEPPGGKAGAAMAKLFGQEPNQTVGSDLRKLQQMLEAGEVATTEGQPVGHGQKSAGGYKLEGSTT